MTSQELFFLYKRELLAVKSSSETNVPVNKHQLNCLHRLEDGSIEKIQEIKQTGRECKLHKLMHPKESVKENENVYFA